MTIKVAKDGYEGVYTPGGGVMLIDGVLHQGIRPVNSGQMVWVPIRTYTGPVEHVDTRGRPVAAAPADGGGRG